MLNILKKNVIILYLVLTLLPMGLYLKDVDGLMIIIVEIFVILCYVCVKNLSSNIFFFLFLFSFFVFLISGDLAEMIFGKYYYIRFEEDAVIHSRICLIISIVSIFFGYLIKKNKKSSIDRKKDDSMIRRIRYTSRIIYYMTFLILLFDTINKVLFVSVNGYVSYYTSYKGILPLFLREVGELAPIALAVFFATFPSKKECKLPIFSYLIYAIVAFMIGARGAFVYNALFLFGYIYYRNRNSNGGKVWISKKTIILLCFSVPCMLVFFQVYGYWRLGQDIVFESFFDSIVDFFVNIGSASKIIKYGFQYRSEIPSWKFYSFGDTLNYFKYGRLFNLFTPENIVSTHSTRFALEGHSFDAYISYLTMGKQYLAGEGAGSSFISVLYADLGYFGVALGSFGYGVMFKALSNLNNNNWLITSIKLYIFYYLLRSPRAAYDGFLAAICNINFIFLILLIYFMAILVRKKYRE